MKIFNKVKDLKESDFVAVTHRSQFENYSKESSTDSSVDQDSEYSDIDYEK